MTAQRRSKPPAGRKRKSTPRTAPRRRSHSTSDEASSDDSSITRCLCGETYSVGMMVCCDKCEVWQHCECVGLLTPQDIPDQYFCEQCKPENHAEYRAANGKTRHAYNSEGLPQVAGPAAAAADRKTPKKRMTMNSQEASLSLEDILATRQVLGLHPVNHAEPTSPTKQHLDVYPTKRKREASSPVMLNGTLDDAQLKDTEAAPGVSPSSRTSKGAKRQKENDQQQANGHHTSSNAHSSSHSSKRASPSKRSQSSAAQNSTGSTSSSSGTSTNANKRARQPRSRTSTPQPADASPSMDVDGSNAASSSTSSTTGHLEPSIHHHHHHHQQQQSSHSPHHLPPQQLHRSKSAGDSLFDRFTAESRAASPPAKVRYPTSRMSLSEMNRRAKQILEYISTIQVDLANKNDDGKKDDENALSTRADASAADNGMETSLDCIDDDDDDASSLSSASTIPLEEDRSRKESQSSLEIMDLLTRELIKFQRKFGATIKAKTTTAANGNGIDSASPNLDEGRVTRSSSVRLAS
ncbi:hypothetical protein BC940DRAFT_304475 [Gongronella butleri]|nr:hypothetical protein BC940DRAFT_304475 [Gongronella butleri]